MHEGRHYLGVALLQSQALATGLTLNGLGQLPVHTRTCEGVAGVTWCTYKCVNMCCAPPAFSACCAAPFHPLTCVRFVCGLLLFNFDILWAHAWSAFLCNHTLW